jgi:hypothetical protein
VLTSTSTISAKRKRGPVLIAVMSLFILVGIIIIISNIGMITQNPALANLTILFPMLFGVANVPVFVSIPGVHYLIIAGITIAVALLDITLCIFIIVSLKKEVFKIYVGLAAVGAFLRILNIIPLIIAWGNPLGTLWFQLFPFVLKGILLVVINMTDGKTFGGFNLNESASTILARKRQEK